MMTGTSGTSKSGKLHTYYGCVGTRKKICNKKNIQKDYIENLVVLEARQLLNDERIDKIAHDLVETAKRERNNDNLKRLNKLLKDNEKQKTNLLNKLKICEIDSVAKSIFEEIEKMENQIKDIKDELLIEESQNVKIGVLHVKFFLNQIKKGDINDSTYRRLITNIMIDKVFIYDDDITMIFNTNDKPYEGKMPSIEELECSFKGSNALPYKFQITNIFLLKITLTLIKKRHMLFNICLFFY